jgi:hypothetical protein
LSIEQETQMPSSTIIGAAGEHYVMCQLLRRDLIAALAPAGVPNADIVVTDKVGDRLFAVQVKVRTDDGVPDAWHMGAKHEEIISPSVFYSFVDFGGSLTAQPKCWVVPSEVVANVLKLSHRQWLATPGARGQAHNDTPMRRFRRCYAKDGLGPEYAMGWLDLYLEKWSLLEAAARDEQDSVPN